ncbi:MULTISPECIES: ribosomal L7Ae/L30e/S12e/Gadd45 family protein [Kosmotoga]|uniref:Ribosomal protein L7Ae/L30e/S12e/Gadd45 n=1 Tax=Kosmotoga olearia (strain ATCC BAA-1733 / DSM 21960 / TBF 19.5.1) TaxID=521045 RepID=C5CDZ5_KOSOT|nr:MULTISPECIES: ribosomal L7Ae/L30e/S12e/Gadd45 family protein [Kosmotoga]ACR80097.1 ribosomal protein L7Ae/L30e/S12e/Gadd45 [Kosmotoga olearia TBF 19.5.1]MDI3523623.1 hypothetical protein [Kosmotoga sp.]MDK2953515.1 hypothetical protein [Kosmotoga sp.]OAA20446.1 50S ribosomal protein L7 [Kosmotoga sp. DU53]
MLGFAAKARKIVFGKDQIRAYLRNRRQKKKVLVLASDASESIKKDWLKRCESQKVPFVLLKNTDRISLAKALGKVSFSAVGVTDEELAAEIVRLAEAGGEKNGEDPSL